MMLAQIMTYLLILYILLNIPGIYLFYRFLKKRLDNILLVWLFSISLSLSLSFLLMLAGGLLFLY